MISLRSRIEPDRYRWPPPDPAADRLDLGLAILLCGLVTTLLWVLIVYAVWWMVS